MKKLALLLLFAGVCYSQVVIILQSPIPQATAPVISPNGGTSSSSIPFTITSPLGGSVIYTVNNTAPTLSNGVTCASPCAVTALIGLTARAISVVSGYSVSAESDAVFIITTAAVATPTYMPSASTYSTVQHVVISSVTPSSGCFYTTDGTTPTTGSTPYTAPVTINAVGNKTLKSLCSASGYTNSAVFSGVFTYSPPATTPVIAPAAGSYSNSVTGSITQSCSGATIYYTTNNTIPTTSSPSGASPVAFTLNASSIVQAMATCPLYSQSAVTAPVSYTINITQPAATPTFAPHAGPYTSTQSVVISSATAGSTIIYTTNGQPPITGTSCASPCTISVASSETVQAVATASGYTTSAIGSATYTIGGSTVLPCPQSSGGLVVNIQSPDAIRTRLSGASPLFIFYDATTSTDSNTLAGANNAFQDVTYSWSFGDSGASGTGTWAYGSRPNQNSTNAATGAVAGHLYIITPGGGDKQFTATVTATDGTNTVSCSAPQITVYDPQGTSVASGGHAYGGTSTICVSGAATPVAGVGGCPTGAAVIQSASASTGISNLSAGKRVLFHCGESYTGAPSVPAIINWSIGAYGGCEGTSTNRPIFGGGINIDMHAGDGRVSDIDCESTSNGNCVISTNNYSFIPYQITLWNLKSSGNNASFYGAQSAQWALVQVNQTGMGSQQGTFFNYAGNNASQWGTNSQFNNLQYLAMIGSNFDGTGATGSGGVETVRVSQGQYEIYENSRFANANTVGAVLKVHAANSKGDAPAFSGMYNQYIEESDNLFYGTSGAQIVEFCSQNVVTDERIQYLIFERNIVNPTVGSHTGLALSASLASVRDNAFLNANQNGVQIAERYSGSPATPPISDEVYNNTFSKGGPGVVFGSGNWAGGPAGTSSFALNNMCYSTGSCVNAGSGNTVSNNTVTVTNNPGFLNGSGSFDVMSDYIPTANYSGGTPVPVFYDALGVQWAPGWDLGAVSHLGSATTAQLKAAAQFSGCTFAGLIGTKDAGSEATGSTQAGTQLTLFSNYVSLINRSHCNYIGRSIDMFTWAPIMSQIDTNMIAWNAQATNPSSIYLGVYMAEKVDTTNTTYACTVAYCNGRDFIFANMCVAGSSGSSCIVDFNQPETVAYFTQVGENLIDRGFQVFLFGKVTATDAHGTATTSQLLATMNTLRSYASSTKGAQVLFIAQNPATAGGPNYINSFDLVQGGVYINPNGTIPNTPIVSNKNSTSSAPERKWLATDYNYVLTNLVEEYDWYGDAWDDSSETACLSIPAAGQTYLTYVRGLTNVPNGTSPNGPGCPLGNVITGSAVPATQATYNTLKALGVGFWLPGRQKLAFPPGEYSPINLTLNTGITPINWNDENMLQIGGSGIPATYKFFAGDAAMSVAYQQNTPQAQWTSDINALKAHPVPTAAGKTANASQMYVAGWRWPFLESGPGTSTTFLTDASTGTGEFAGFQQILSAYTYLEAQIPGASFGISIMGVVAGASYNANTIKTNNWSNHSQIVPAYVANGGCPAACGTLTVQNNITNGTGGTSTYPIASIYATSSYYGMGFTAFCNTGSCPSTGILTFGMPAFWSPGVNQAYIIFWQALSRFSYCAPPGHPFYNASCTTSTPALQLTFDTDPLIAYIFSNDEYSYTFNSSDNPTDSGGVTVNLPRFLGASDTPSNTNFYNAYFAWARAATNFFPHTLIGANVTFGFGAQHGNDTPAIVASNVNQYIGGATSLSNIQGLALTSSDTLALDFAAGTKQTANCALQGYVGIVSPGCFAGPPPVLGTYPGETSLNGSMPRVVQVQPIDYGTSTGSGCTNWTTCAVTNISAAANNAYNAANLRIWSMGDGSTFSNTAWTTYIASTLNGGGAGVTPFSTVRPTNLP